MIEKPDPTEEELRRYQSLALRASLFISVILLLLVGIAALFVLSILVKPLIGALIGAVLASINVFALGYAYYRVVIAKGSRTLVLWPVLSFIVMVIVGICLAHWSVAMCIGFALGLCAPLAIACYIIFNIK